MTYVLGLDLSLTSTGIAQALLPRLQVNNIKSKGTRKDTWKMRRDRIYALANDVLDVAGKPDMAVIEAPSYGSQYGSQHDRSGLWWLVTGALLADDIPVVLVSPQGRAKFATGSGRAKKDVVMAHAVERYTDLLGHRIANDDIADAIVLCDIGAHLLGRPLVPGLPEENLAALEGVTWASV